VLCTSPWNKLIKQKRAASPIGGAVFALKTKENENKSFDQTFSKVCRGLGGGAPGSPIAMGEILYAPKRAGPVECTAFSLSSLRERKLGLWLDEFVAHKLEA
jgi:hypothetical protein